MRRHLTTVILVLAIALLWASPAHAQKKKKKPATPTATDTGDGEKKKRSKKQRVFDFGAFGIEGSMRTPQLLYFLGRAKQELDRASLEKRSFMPELTRSVDEGGL